MVEDVHDVSKHLVTGVRLRNVKTGEIWEQDVDGFFVAIGHIPNTKVFKGQIETDADGYIVSHGGARTNIPGVFHAGDVQDRDLPPGHHRLRRGLHGGHRSRTISGSGRTLNYDRAHSPSGRARARAAPIRPAVRAGDFIYVSGQVPVDPHHGPGRQRRCAGRDAPGAHQHPATFWRAAARRWRTWCAARVYLTDAADFTAMNEVYAEFFGDAKPARTTVVVAALPLPGAKVEIDAIAYQPAAARRG